MDQTQKSKIDNLEHRLELLSASLPVISLFQYLGVDSPCNVKEIEAEIRETEHNIQYFCSVQDFYNHAYIKKNVLVKYNGDDAKAYVYRFSNRRRVHGWKDIDVRLYV